MAFWNNKEEINDLKQQIAKQDKEIEVLKQQHQNTEQSNSTLQEQLEQQKSSQDWQASLFSNLNTFGST